MSGLTNFPVSKDSWVAKVDTSDKILAEHVNKLQEAEAAMQTKLGIDGSTDTTSIEYILKNAAQFDPGHRHTANALITAAIAGQDTYTMAPATAIGGYVANQLFIGKAASANTSTTPTLNVSGKGAKTIKKLGGSALVAGDIAAGMVCFLFYDGTDMLLLNPAYAVANVDGSTLEVSAGVIRVKASGITANEIASGAVGADEIASGAVSTDEIATNAVGADEIAAGAVGASELAAGCLAADKYPAPAAGDWTLASCGAARITEGSLTLKAQFYCPKAGSLRTRIGIVADTSETAVTAQVYKNGSAAGTQRSNSAQNYAYFNEDISFNAGDTLELYAQGTGWGYMVLGFATPLVATAKIEDM